MENHKRGLPVNVKTHLTPQKTDVFLLIYLLKIITSIIKANTTIVSVIKLNNNKYIIFNKNVSIICTTSILTTLSYGLKVANHICLFSFPMFAIIT